MFIVGAAFCLVLAVIAGITYACFRLRPVVLVPEAFMARIDEAAQKLEILHREMCHCVSTPNLESSVAVLDVAGQRMLLRCPFEELRPPPVLGARYIIEGDLYRVIAPPVSHVGAAGNFDAQLIQARALLYSSDNPAAAAIQGIRDVARDLSQPGSDKPTTNTSSRLVYVQLKLEKKSPLSGFLNLLSGNTDKQAARKEQ